MYNIYIGGMEPKSASVLGVCLTVGRCSMEFVNPSLMAMSILSIVEQIYNSCCFFQRRMDNRIFRHKRKLLESNWGIQMFKTFSKRGKVCRHSFPHNGFDTDSSYQQSSSCKRNINSFQVKYVCRIKAW